MPVPRDVIHQIEYRWQHEKDLSPFDTTMSESETDGWNDLVRAWVRHPDAAGLFESWCYQTWNRDAALAWRYRDPRAAERPDGTTGRPHVSRVLVGDANSLTPELAIAFCLFGLPGSAQPHWVSVPGDLPTISAYEFTTELNKVAADLDGTAAQEEGLPELVAAALSDRDQPLAVYLPEHVIIGQATQKTRVWLLWGLHRIMGAVPGAGRRGWSFSTFELALGAQDTTTLPDIVFRGASRESAPPGIVRDEVKVWPLDPDWPADLPSNYVRSARQLVEAYAAHGVDGVEQLVAGHARVGQTGLTVRARQGTTEGEIYHDAALTESALPEPAGQQPAALSHTEPPYRVGPGALDPQPTGRPSAEAASPPTRILPVGRHAQQESAGVEAREPRSGPEPAAAINSPAPPQPAVTVTTTAVRLIPGREPGDMEVDAAPNRPVPGQPAAQPGHGEQSGDRHKYGNLASSREGQADPPLSLGGLQQPTRQRPATFSGQPVRDPHRHASVDYMLKQMQEAPDQSAVREILRFIVEYRADLARSDRPEARDERQKARRTMAGGDWYDSVTQSSGYKLEARELARIFLITVIPDLGKAEDVMERIAGWADGADPMMIRGLLMAARDAGVKERAGLMARMGRKDSLEQVRQIMLPRLATRWARDTGVDEWWTSGQRP